MVGNRQGILEAADQLQPEAVRLLQEFIRIPTVNPSGEKHESFVSYMSEVLGGLGYEAAVIRVPESRLPELAPHGQGLPRPNLVARLEGAGDGPQVHLNGHYDMVPAGNDWNRDPFCGKLEDGRVYGHGAADMKGDLVAQVYAVEALVFT